MTSAIHHRSSVAGRWLARWVLGGVAVAILATTMSGCARSADEPNQNAGPGGSGQLGDAPGGDAGAGAPDAGSGPTTPPTTAPPEELPPPPKPTLSPLVLLPLDPALLIPWPSPADCVSHNPATVSVQQSGDLWQVLDGGHALLAYRRQVDAEDGLALAKAYRKHCFIGRGNTRADRERYIMDYWLEPVQPSPAIASPDCLEHNPANLTVVDLGALGFRVEEGGEAIALFDTKTDADNAVLVMRHYNRHCYVGRGYGGSDRLKYITNWFARV